MKVGDLVMIKWTMSHNFQKQVAGVVLRIDRNQVEVLLHNSDIHWFSSWELEGADESR
jgi:ribosome maturation factor RimP